MDTINTAVYKMAVQGTESVNAAGASVDRLVVSEEKVTRATRMHADAMERMLGRLDPRIRAEQQLQAALAQVNRFEEEGIGNAAQRAQAIGAATTRYNDAIQRISGTRAQDTFLGAGNAAKLSAFQIQNLSFQLQDVGQALATGQPLFTTFIQQGSQIAQIFGPGVGVLGALKAVGTGVATFLMNPLTLAVVAFAAATAGAAAFIRAISGPELESTEDLLKRHKDLIDQITDAYGESTAAARAMGAAQGQALESRSLLARIELTDRLRETSRQLRDEFGSLFQLGNSQALLGGIGVSNPFANWDVPQGFIDKARQFREDFANGVADVEAYREELDQLGQNFPTSEALKFVASEIEATQAAYDLTQQQKELEAALAGSTARVIGMTDALRNSFAAGFGADIVRQAAAGRQNVPFSDFGGRFDPIAVGAKESAEEAERLSKSLASEAERAAEAIQKVKDQLAFQTEQLYRTNVEKEIYNNLHSAGVDILSADGQAIAEATRTLYAQEEALKKRNELIDIGKSLTKDFVSGLSSDLANGASAVDALTSAFDRLATKLLDLALDQAINSLFSTLLGAVGGGGGYVGAGGIPVPGSNPFFNAHGNAFAGGNVIPFARGGVVDQPTIFPMARGMGLMGEAGPEAVMPLKRGSDGRLGVEAAGATQAPINDNRVFHIDARGAQRGVGEEIRAALTEYDRGLPDRMEGIRQHPRRR